MHLSDQKHGHWNDYRHPPKAVVEKVYESNPLVQLPASLTGRPVISSRNRRQPAFNPPFLYPPGPLLGWPPYMAPNVPAPYPPSTISGPSIAPFYPPFSAETPTNIPSNSTAEGYQTRRSPSYDDKDVRYPSIAEFFAELMETESSEHYFTNYTEAFRNEGYYRVDELAHEDLTVGYMVEIIDHLKEGTARVIKRKAVDKVKKIHKGKGKSRAM